MESTAESILTWMMEPHAAAADSLVRNARRGRSSPQHSALITAGVAIFSAGLDKVTSTACIFLCIAGDLDPAWLVPKGYKGKPGHLICRKGLSAKLIELRKRGALTTDLDWLVELRNEFMHGHGLFAGYRVTPVNDETLTSFVLKAHADIGWSGEFDFPTTHRSFRQTGRTITREIGLFIDNRTAFRKRYTELANRVEALPEEPIALVESVEDLDRVMNDARALTLREIGQQWAALLTRRATEPDWE